MVFTRLVLTTFSQKNVLAVQTEQELKAPEEGLAPSIVSKPKAQAVNEGETMHFECSLTAKPAPEVECLSLHSQVFLH